ncbi:hypothetical protein M433DRAFT_155471 [Acidomyces richmondensis BFW]|nr:MAG: hypothetical protein FE78DRAFT_92270 [Acidomyces sp. 'richmondensis']KYG44576.1 hypothetical protein M433DRAFT_155471 [Acidomyces richmondensis BFW]
MPSPNRVQISQNEGSIMPAIISAAAKAYNVQIHALQKNYRKSSREHLTLTNKKLSKTKEELLIKDILKLDLQCHSPSLSLLLVKNTVDKYGILLEDTYNFDETSFQMGQINTSIVVKAIDRQGRPKQVKLTNTT